MNDHYNKAIDRLSDWLRQNELQRREWSNEKWGHPEGRWFKLSRLFTQVLSVLLIITLIIYCLIRYEQLILKDMLSYDPDVSNIEVYIVTMVACSLALIVGTILIVNKKHKSGALTQAITSFLIFLHIATQVNIPMPSNSDKYRVLCFVILTACAFTILFSMSIFIILTKDKKETKRMVDNTLSKITKGKASSLEITDYSKVINDYIDEQKASRKANKV